MAGAGFKDFQAGAKLTADQVDTYLMQQSVMRFASSAARSSAIGTAVAEGMMSYLDDSNSIEVYNGSSWVGLESTLNDGTAGYTALSNGTAGITYQPVSHNYIINGAFDVWQRGTSISGALADNTYLADRWKNIWTGGGNPTSVSVTQTAFTPNEVNAIGFGEAENYQKMAITTVGVSTGYRIEHDIEDVRTLAAQTISLSFWVKSNAAHSFSVTAIQQFGSGGSAANFDSFTMSQSTLPTSWTRVTGTATLSSISGKTIGAGSKLTLRFDFGTDADGDELSIWGVQLEAGSVATPFKRHAPSLQGELAACQRYYQAHNALPLRGYISGFSAFRIASALPVVMRATPSVTFSGTPVVFDGSTTASVSTITGEFNTPSKIELDTTNSALLVTGRPAMIIGTSGTFQISAEL